MTPPPKIEEKALIPTHLLLPKYHLWYIVADGLKEVIVNTYEDITARMEEGTVNR